MTTLRFVLLCTFVARLSGSDIGLFQNTGSATANLVVNPGPSQQVIAAAATGFYDNFGNGTGTYAGPQFDPSYFTGSVAGTEFRSYFIFDLSSLPPALTVNAARLDLHVLDLGRLLLVRDLGQEVGDVDFLFLGRRVCEHRVDAHEHDDQDRPDQDGLVGLAQRLGPRER